MALRVVWHPFFPFSVGRTPLGNNRNDQQAPYFDARNIGNLASEPFVHILFSPINVPLFIPGRITLPSANPLKWQITETPLLTFLPPHRSSGQVIAEMPSMLLQPLLHSVVVAPRHRRIAGAKDVCVRGCVGGRLFEWVDACVCICGGFSSCFCCLAEVELCLK